MNNRPFSSSVDQSGRQPVSSSTTGSQRMDNRPLSPSSGQIAGQHRPMTSPTVANVYSRPFSSSADQSGRQPVSSSTGGSQRMDNRPFSPSSVNQFAADRALSPFSPSVSFSSIQRPSSAPSSAGPGGTDGTIQGYRRICFSPIPQPVQPGHRASPIPLMLSQQPGMTDGFPATANKESRISLSGARLVFTPRRGSDVTASTPGSARAQLTILRENQVADWTDNRSSRPVMWTPPTAAAAAGRSQSLEPISGNLHSYCTVLFVCTL